MVPSHPGSQGPSTQSRATTRPCSSTDRYLRNQDRTPLVHSDGTSVRTPAKPVPPGLYQYSLGVAGSQHHATLETQTQRYNTQTATTKTPTRATEANPSGPAPLPPLPAPAPDLQTADPAQRPLQRLHGIAIPHHSQLISRKKDTPLLQTTIDDGIHPTFTRLMDGSALFKFPHDRS